MNNWLKLCETLIFQAYFAEFLYFSSYFFKPKNHAFMIIGREKVTCVAHSKRWR